MLKSSLSEGAGGFFVVGGGAILVLLAGWRTRGCVFLIRIIKMTFTLGYTHIYIVCTQLTHLQHYGQLIGKLKVQSTCTHTLYDVQASKYVITLSCTCMHM